MAPLYTAGRAVGRGGGGDAEQVASLSDIATVNNCMSAGVGTSAEFAGNQAPPARVAGKSAPGTRSDGRLGAGRTHTLPAGGPINRFAQDQKED